MWYCSPAGERGSETLVSKSRSDVSKHLKFQVSTPLFFPAHNNTMVNKSCNVTFNVVFFMYF